MNNTAYIKLPDQYPYWPEKVRTENPDVSFPEALTDELLEEFGVFPVILTAKPIGDVVIETAPSLIDGVWTQQWSSRDFTEEEMTEKRNSQSTSQRKARLALLQTGMLSQVEAALEAMEEPDRTAAKIEWEYAIEIKRENPLVQGLTATLGWTEQQLDELFALAESIPD